MRADVELLPRDRTDDDLKMELAEWKRWRSRVWHAPVMRRRQERFDEACAHIVAIERELAARTPAEKDRRRRATRATVWALARLATVSLDAYREARSELDRLERRLRR